MLKWYALILFLEFNQLKQYYHTILQLMPDDYEQSVGKLQNHISDDQLCDILTCTSNCRAANTKLLNCLIEKLTCKEDLLDFCDQLERIAASNDLIVIIEELKTGLCLNSTQEPPNPTIENTDIHACQNSQAVKQNFVVFFESTQLFLLAPLVFPVRKP